MHLLARFTCVALALLPAAASAQLAWSDAQAVLLHYDRTEAFRAKARMSVLAVEAQIVKPPPFDPSFPEVRTGAAVVVRGASGPALLATEAVALDAKEVAVTLPSGEQVKARVSKRLRDLPIVTLSIQPWPKALVPLELAHPSAERPGFEALTIGRLGMGGSEVVTLAHLISQEPTDDSVWICDVRGPWGFPLLTATGELLGIAYLRPWADPERTLAATATLLRDRLGLPPIEAPKSEEEEPPWDSDKLHPEP
jgi:hypothetical protein